MEKALNLELISKRTEELGYTLTKLSELIGVSKEAVSQWYRGESYPRPAKLLKLSSLLNLTYDEIVQASYIAEPIVAYRKVKGAKTVAKHIIYAKEIGFSLENLVSFLPFETLTTPQVLKDPALNYSYVQTVTSTFRSKFGISSDFVNIRNILSQFSFYKATLIPLLVGGKKNHENALHIYLPESGTNGVFVNLDTNILDFKFWILHEFAHIVSPTLRNEESEIFADDFAGAFLFPEESSSSVYQTLSEYKNGEGRIKHIMELAEALQISPYTIIKELEKFSKHHSLLMPDLGQHNPKDIAVFQKRFPWSGKKLVKVVKMPTSTENECRYELQIESNGVIQKDNLFLVKKNNKWYIALIEQLQAEGFH